MKKTKAIGSRKLGNRTIIGILCVVAALAICFGVAPAVNRAKELYFGDRGRWDEMVLRDMARDVSWAHSADQYIDLYRELAERA